MTSHTLDKATTEFIEKLLSQLCFEDTNTEVKS